MDFFVKLNTTPIETCDTQFRMRTFIQGFRDSSLKLSVLQPPPIRKPPPPPPPIKGSLISEGILTSLPTKGVKFIS